MGQIKGLENFPGFPCFEKPSLLCLQQEATIKLELFCQSIDTEPVWMEIDQCETRYITN